MLAPPFPVWSRIASVACWIACSSCLSQDQELPDWEGFEGGAGPVAIPPAPDSQALRQRFRSPLGTGAGDDVRVSAFTDRSISENSIAVHPSKSNVLLCANNSKSSFGEVQVGWSSDGGSTWSEMLVETANVDPATAIDRDGTFYVGYMLQTSYQGVSISSDDGNTWHRRFVPDSGSSDKNHLVVDTSEASPFEGRLYVAWTQIGITPHPDNKGHIVLSASGDRGTSWTPVQRVSARARAFDVGANLQTGPFGELYCCWAIFDGAVSRDEFAIGFNVSFDGGDTFLGPTRALTALRGTSTTGVPNTPIAATSYPSMAVDRTSGPRSGWIYVFWTNIGVPGVNVGDADVYVARSRDRGSSWDAPVRVNDDATTNAQWQVWGTCDQANGDLYAVFLDRREDPADVLARAWVARSTDGGETWVNQPVGDQQFTPRGIPSNPGYMGHYIGIAAQGGRAYPLWSDWRESSLTAYTSPLVFDIAPPLVSCPAALTIEGSAIGGAAASDPGIAAFLSEASAQDELDPAPEIVSDAPAFFPLGTTLVTFTARDDAGHESQCSAPLTVVDTVPPAFEVTPSPAVLAPADHRLVPVDVTALVADAVDPEAGFELVSIGSSERDSGLGPGDLAKDIQDVQLGTPDARFLLRAENYSRGTGRLYTIKYVATDAAGNRQARVLDVRVEP